MTFPWKEYALLFVLLFVACLSALTTYNVVYNKYFAEEEETSCLQLPGPVHNAPAAPALRRNPDAKGPGVARPD